MGKKREKVWKVCDMLSRVTARTSGSREVVRQEACDVCGKDTRVCYLCVIRVACHRAHVRQQGWSVVMCVKRSRVVCFCVLFVVIRGRASPRARPAAGM